MQSQGELGRACAIVPFQQTSSSTKCIRSTQHTMWTQMASAGPLVKAMRWVITVYCPSSSSSSWPLMMLICHLGSSCLPTSLWCPRISHIKINGVTWHLHWKWKCSLKLWEKISFFMVECYNNKDMDKHFQNCFSTPSKIERSCFFLEGREEGSYPPSSTAQDLQSVHER